MSPASFCGLMLRLPHGHMLAPPGHPSSLVLASSVFGSSASLLGLRQSKIHRRISCLTGSLPFALACHAVARPSRSFSPSFACGPRSSCLPNLTCAPTLPLCHANQKPHAVQHSAHVLRAQWHALSQDTLLPPGPAQRCPSCRPAPFKLLAPKPFVSPAHQLLVLPTISKTSCISALYWAALCLPATSLRTVHPHPLPQPARPCLPCMRTASCPTTR